MTIEWDAGLQHQYEGAKGREAMWLANLEAARHQNDWSAFEEAGREVALVKAELREIVAAAQVFAQQQQHAQAQAARDPLLDNEAMRSVIEAMPYRYNNGADMSLEDKVKTYRWSAGQQQEKARREAEEALRGFNRG